MPWRPFTSPAAWRLRPRRRAQLRIAPLRLRLLAVVINAAMTISALAVLLVAGARVDRTPRRVWPSPGGAPPPPPRPGPLFRLGAPRRGGDPPPARAPSPP